jgi:hypothetical protein
MTKDEALRLALEALQELEDTNSYWWQEVDEVTTKKIDPAITAIKAALEAKDETHAYGYAKRLAEAIWSKHYKTTAPQWEPFDELIGVLTQIDNMTAGLISPPQRKPLTDEEMKAVVEQELVNYWDGEYIDTTGAKDCLTKFAQAIEAKHGIKGEA